MKNILIILTALISAPAFAGKILCENKAVNALDGENAASEVVETLEIVGVLDAEGLLDVRKDVDSMATITSKAQKINICSGYNIDPDQDPQGKKVGWKSAKLNSGAYRIRLIRDQQTGEVKAVAATAEAKLIFRSCTYEKTEGDDEAVNAMFKELEDTENDPETVKWREEIKERDEATDKAAVESAAAAAGTVR